jgi:hypothetical protein
METASHDQVPLVPHSPDGNHHLYSKRNNNKTPNETSTK